MSEYSTSPRGQERGVLRLERVGHVVALEQLVARCRAAPTRWRRPRRRSGAAPGGAAARATTSRRRARSLRTQAIWSLRTHATSSVRQFDVVSDLASCGCAAAWPSGSSGAARRGSASSRWRLVARNSGLDRNCSRVRGRGSGTSMISATRPGLRAEHHDAVGEVHGLVEIVGDEHDRDVDLLPDLEQVAPASARASARRARANGSSISRMRGLVGQRARDRHALLHAARELVRVRVGELAQARRSRATRSASPRRALARRVPLHLEAEHHVLLHRAATGNSV